jgi:UDP-2,3-diacylglucosamine pyrophosphatase LpxH
MRYFISDLHIGDRTAADRFGRGKAALLVKLLERIDKDMSHSGELVLLGDIFDFTLLQGQETPGQKIDSARVFSRVRKAYPHLFQALREFILSGNRLFYVWGNHDYPMRFKNHGQQFQRAVMAKFWDSWRRESVIWISDYYISRSHSLYAEHGHRYDIANVHLEGGHAALGTLLALKLIKKWESWESKPEVGGENLEETPYPFRFLGDIRPLSHIINYLNRLIEKEILPEEIKKELAKDLYKIVEEWKSSLPENILIRLLENLPWFIQEEVLGLRLKDEAPKVLREKAKLLLDGFSTDMSAVKRKVTVGSVKDLDFAPKIVIFGHTHFPDHKVEKDKYVYGNTGSWRDTVFVDQEGRMVKIPNHCPYVEVIPPKYGELPKAIFRRAVDGGEINIQELIKDYEKFGLGDTLGYA